MKGPGLRIDLDVRRVWRCATCGRTARTAAHVVAQRCGCSELSPWMILQSPLKRTPFQPPVREPLPELDVTEDRPVTPHPVVEVPVAEVPVAELSPEIAPAADSSFSESPVEASRSALDQTTAATESPVASPSAAAAESAAAAPASPAPTPEDPRPDEFGAGLSDVASAPQP